MIIDSPIISGSSVASGSLNQFGNVTITGSVNVSGSFTSTGTLTAQTLVVQTITSSVVYSSGSNIFGNDLANTQVLTGSVSITGSLAVNGSNAVLSNQTSSMSASYAANATSASYAANATSASYATTASFSLNVPITASYANNANSASYANNATSASYANNATSASYATTASFSLNVPITSSYADNANSASYALSASFATTASYLTGYISPFPFTGSAIISGSLTVTGSVAVSNLSGSGVRYLIADDSGSVTAQSASAALKSTQAFTSTAGQTTFAVTNGYSTGYVDVFINGSKLATAEFTDTSGTNIVLATGSFINDTVEVVKYTPAAGVTNNVLRQLTTFTASAAQTVFSASYTPGLLDIFYNGARLTPADFTANNGTFFTLATASAANDILDVLVYSYQVGAFSGIGGVGTATQVAYFDTTNSITGSPNFTISGSTMTITGSLIVSGSGTFTNIGPAVFSGSITSTAGFTGSFSGTATSASYAANADALDGLDSTVFTLTSSFTAQTASFNAFSASILTYTSSQNTLNGTYALTSSFNEFSASILAQTASLNSFSASVLTFTGSAATRLGALEAATSSLYSYTSSLNNQTASFATTGSNTFIGTQTISGSILQSGSFTTTGTIIAQTINVQTVTSSIIYSSGSNIFGNLLNNTQTFTGSVLITGSLTIAGASSATSYSGTTIYGSTAVCSPVGLFSGCVGIGTATPTYDLTLSKSVAAGNVVLNIENTSTTGAARLWFGNNAASTGARIQYFGATHAARPNLFSIGTDAANDMMFETAGTERMRITCAGNVLIGTSTISTAVSTNDLLTIGKSGSTSNAIIFSNGVTTNWGFIVAEACKIVLASSNNITFETGAGSTERMRLCSNGFAYFACELTAKTIGTNDLLLNNLNYECANYVDGTRGSWLIQEGACDLFIINQVSCKKYKFNLIEIK